MGNKKKDTQQRDEKEILKTILCQQIWQPRRNGQIYRNIQST